MKTTKKNSLLKNILTICFFLQILDFQNARAQNFIPDEQCRHTELADLNADQDVNVLDIVLFVDLVLLKNNSLVICHENADLNGDKKSNILDIVLMVSWILTPSQSSFVSVDISALASDVSFQDDILFIQNSEQILLDNSDSSSTQEAKNDETITNDSSTQTVEEGDIFKMIQSNLLANLNPMTGLQIFDLSDLDNIQLISRVSLLGQPFEMYYSRGYLLVLLNNWKNYYKDASSDSLSMQEGALVLVYDTVDPYNLEEVSRHFVEGRIFQSRIIKDQDHSRLYVLSQQMDSNWQPQTYIASFLLEESKSEAQDIEKKVLQKHDELHVPSNVSHIQATNEAIILARNQYLENGAYIAYVSLINISQKDVPLSLSKEITTKGMVENQFNLDVYKNVLRVVSEGGTWQNPINYIETFNFSDPLNPSLLDSQSFGEGERLFATIFLENKAFFVTYFQTDPFHAFFIDDNGQIEEKAEFIVSGWNDFFKPVSNNTRLIGSGVDDQSGIQQMAISLYNIEELENPFPLIARQIIHKEEHSWSQAQWDHKAFTVIENVVNIPAKEVFPSDGVDESQSSLPLPIENHLVLLPYSFWNETLSAYEHEVQIFSFSDFSLSKRGVLQHNQAINRSFLSNTGTAANISPQSLSVFEIENLEYPHFKAEIELAPHYDSVFHFKPFDKDYFVRHTKSQGSVFPPEQILSSRLDIFLSKEDLLSDKNILLSLKIPASAHLYQVGSKLLVIDHDYYESLSRIEIYSFSQDITENTQFDSHIIEAPLLQSQSYYEPYVMIDCIDCYMIDLWPQTSLQDSVHSYKSGLIFEDSSFEIFIDYIPCDIEHTTESTVDEQQTLLEEEQHLTAKEDECIQLVERWQKNIKLHILDLKDKENPQLYFNLKTPVSALDSKEAQHEVKSIFNDDQYLWLNTFIKNTEEENDLSLLPSGRYYSYSLDLSTLESSQNFKEGINVPGEIIASKTQGFVYYIFTKEKVWKEKVIEEKISSLEIRKQKAALLQSLSLEGSNITKVISSLASDDHQRLYLELINKDKEQNITQSILVLNKDPKNLESLFLENIPYFLELKLNKKDQLFFKVPSGILSYKIFENEKQMLSMQAQAFYPSLLWPKNLVFLEDNSLIYSDSRRGLFDFFLHLWNILEE